MKVNFSIVVDIFIPLATLILGFVLTRLVERKPKVGYYLGYVSSFTHQVTKTKLNSHSIVVFNNGKKTAKNVRVGHNLLPRNFDINPSKACKTERTSGGGKDIKFSTLVPNETVTISYLYSLPVTFQQINSQVKHDEGLAKLIPVLPTRQYPKWQIRIFKFLILLGIIAFIYLSYVILSRLIALIF